MTKYAVHACTDITGFGLLGHLYEMAKGSGLSIELSYKDIPIFESAIEYAEMGFVPAGAYSNRAFVGTTVDCGETPRAIQDILFDPQTSGGLIISVAEHDAQALLQELCTVLEPTVCGKPAIIGRVVQQRETALHVR